MRPLILIAVLLAAGPVPAQQPETLSLLGKPLFAPPIDSDTRKQLEADLAAARVAYGKRPDADAARELGEAMASLGRFGEAIEVYTRAIEASPNDARLYAERAKAFLTLRKFDLAIRDLSKAAQPVEGKPTTTDPDIQYDLGLAHYCKGEFSPAADAFRSYLKVSKAADTVPAASFWLYVSLQRMHKLDEANVLLQQVPTGSDAEEAYVRLLQFYKGALPENDLEGKGPNGVTAAYGIAVRGLWNGAIDEARTSLKRIVEKDVKYWTAPAYIAAEAELARLTPAERKKLKLK